MKGHIDSDGRLVIERGKVPRIMVCPFTKNTYTSSKDRCCGDWCPHFDDPVEGEPGTFVLPICHGKVLALEEFSDERSKGGSI